MDTIPQLLAKVRLQKSGELYLVVDVDFDRELVELLSITGTQHLVPHDVGFSKCAAGFDRNPRWADSMPTMNPINSHVNLSTVEE